MAIYLIEGKIGSGKTYYCVHSLSRKYFDWDELLQEFIPKKNVTIVTNVEGLKLEHISLQYEIDKRGVQGVFSESYVNELRQQSNARNVIFIIDETQKFFDRKFYNKDVFFFFQYSRHYGVDVYLITQDVDSLAKEIRNLPEYVIHAVARSSTSGTSFAYKLISNDEVFKTVVVPMDNKVFKLYRSFNFDELEKPKPIYYRYIAIFGGLIVLAVLGYFFLFSPTFLRGDSSFSYDKVKGKVQKSKPSDINPKPFPAGVNPSLPMPKPQSSKNVQFKEVSVPISVPSYKPVGSLVLEDNKYTMFQSDTDVRIVKNKVIPSETPILESSFIDGYNLYGSHFKSGSAYPVEIVSGAAAQSSPLAQTSTPAPAQKIGK